MSLNLSPRLHRLLTITFILSFTPALISAETDNSPTNSIPFSFSKLTAWEEIRFNGLTNYRLLNQADGVTLKADSKASASGLLLKKTIDITKTPFLNWRWKLEKGLPELDEQKKNGDDYAARIYLIHSGGWFFWQTQALNYVWSSRDSKGSSWPNAYAPDNALMKAVRDKTDKADSWYSEKRNVAKDFQDWLKQDISQIEGVAIMTDTDDSGGHAIVYYADIFFSAD